MAREVVMLFHLDRRAHKLSLYGSDVSWQIRDQDHLNKIMRETWENYIAAQPELLRQAVRDQTMLFVRDVREVIH